MEKSPPSWAMAGLGNVVYLEKHRFFGKIHSSRDCGILEESCLCGHAILLTGQGRTVTESGTESWCRW